MRVPGSSTHGLKIFKEHTFKDENNSDDTCALRFFPFRGQDAGRPLRQACDSAHLRCIAEAVEGIDCDIIVNVQGDEPFVTRGPLENLISVFSGPDADRIDLASMVQQIKNPEFVTDPNYVKVVMDKDNFALYFSRSPIPYPREKHMDIKYYEHVGVYAFRRQSLLDFARNAQLQNEMAEKIECIRYLEYGQRIKMVEAPFVSIEVDTPQDLENARKLFKSLHGQA